MSAIFQIWTQRVAPIFLLAVAVVCQFVPGVALGATYSVPADRDALQTAIENANPGDAIIIGPGVFSGPLVVVDKSDLTIRGSGEGVTIISGTATSFPIVYSGAVGVTLSDLTLDGDGQANTAIVVTQGQVPSDVTLERLTISHFIKVAIFVGTGGCKPTPQKAGAVWPACYAEGERQKYLDASHVVIRDCTVEDNGVFGKSGTGIVFYPGTSGLVQGTTVNRCQFTGIFIWGSAVDVAGSTFDQNVESAVEYRLYPTTAIKTGTLYRASGEVRNCTLKRGVKRPEGTLGGGSILHGADVTFTANTITNNAAWGVSASDGCVMNFSGNTISANKGSGVIIDKTSRAVFSADTESGNGQSGIIINKASRGEFSGITCDSNKLTGIAIQERSMGEITGGKVRWNQYGVTFTKQSWGAVQGTLILGNKPGSGIYYDGSPKALAVEGNTIRGSTNSGVVFAGSAATGTIQRNVFRYNQPLNVDCTGGGRPDFGAKRPLKVDSRCMPPLSDTLF